MQVLTNFDKGDGVSNNDDFKFVEDKEKVEINEAADGGWGWIVVLGSFFASFLCDGITYTMGALTPLLIEHFKISRNIIGWIGSIQVSMTLCSGVLGDLMIRKYGYRKTTVIGAVLSSVGYIIPFLWPSLTCIFIGPCFITGLGFGLVYQTSITIVNVWFDRRLGVAMGVSICGSGLGTFAMSPVIDLLVSWYGWQGCMAVIAALLMHLIPIGMLFRVPSKPKRRQQSISSCSSTGSRNSTSGPPCPCCSLSYRQMTHNPVFLILAFSNALANLGFNAPFLYLTDRALQYPGISEAAATMLLSVTGLGYTLGQLGFGATVTAVPSVSSVHFYACSLLLCGLVLSLSGLALIYPLMMLYTSLFGFFSGGYVALLPLTLKEFLGNQNVNKSFAFINVFQSIAVLLGPPLIGFIYDSLESYDVAFMFCGISFMLSGSILYFLKCVKTNRQPVPELTCV